MKERTQKSNLACEKNQLDSLDDYNQNEETDLLFENSVQSLISNSSYVNHLPTSASSTSVASLAASSISVSRDSNLHFKKFTKTFQQPTTAQDLQTYLASKKIKQDEPDDHIKSFFIVMEATTRRLSPILQIEAKGKISALLSDLEM